MRGPVCTPSPAQRPVLILASDADHVGCATHEALKFRGTPVVRLDPGCFPDDWGLSWSVLSSEGSLGRPEERIELQQVRSVLARPACRSTHGSIVDDDGEYIAAEIAATMLGLLTGLNCRVVNRPAPGGVGRTIVRDASKVAACGFRLTPALTTSDPAAALRFYRQDCDERALLAPASGQQGPALIEGEQGAASLACCASAAVVLQSAPEGEMASVWVVGDHAISANRRAASVHPACLRAATTLGLDLARFDLVLSPEHATCLEASELPELPDDSSARAEFIGALCDLLASPLAA